jgi:hypothetical protein
MVGGTRFTARFTQRALVAMKEREKILSGEEKTSRPARQLFVSLDRADNVIEGAQTPI